MSSWSSESVLAEALEKSTDVNSLVTINNLEVSQLMVACLHGNIEYLEELLKVPGIKLDLENGEGKSALIYACEEGHTEIVQLILNAYQHFKHEVIGENKEFLCYRMVVSL